VMRAALVIFAYVLGSVPFGLIVAKSYGVDLRGQGSGNIGATNALRVLGKKAGAITLLGDMLKGLIGALIALKLGGRETGILAAAAAVIGHDFPVFAGFRGGKGVATSFGVVLALEPFMGLAGLVIWLLAVAVTRISSLGALASFSALPALALAFLDDRLFVALTVFLAALIFVKHRDNIMRIARGEEPGVGSNKVRREN